MDAIELARRLAGLGQSREACRAYALALNGAAPEEKMEAALYILQSGGDYRISYTCFQELYSQGHFRADCLSAMTGAFYEPNVKTLKKRYEKNRRLLEKYPYLFRKDFLPFEQLPIRFYPYDDNGYLPFFAEEERFGDYINFKNPVVSRNFFKDLEKPILADSVFSQYELEYLCDNVRDSERVGRENHVYLHYPDWGEFCSFLQCWDLRPLLKRKKLVFLIGEEIGLYPIDFKARFGIDYSRYPPQPLGIREIHRLIWHTQLSAHNGGDFFNEVFDNHPNLLAMTSVYLSAAEELIAEIRTALKEAGSLERFLTAINWRNPRVLAELYRLDSPSDKDILVAMYLGASKIVSGTDQNARVAPAIFFQPHFETIANRVREDGEGKAVIVSEAEESIHQCRFFREFPYIKTFTPMRRITNSYAASMRFMYESARENEAAEAADPKVRKLIVGDIISERVLNRSFMVDPEDRLYRDSVLVRFEDGKLNPKATFAALAAFLDLPCTESMRVCTVGGTPVSYLGSDQYAPGFDPGTVYRTYEDFANDTERYYIEYFMRDAYEHYGYDFHIYDGAAVDQARLEELISGFTTIDRYIRELWWKVVADVDIIKEDWQVTGEERQRVRQEMIDKLTDKHLQEIRERRLRISELLLRGLRPVNRNGQPLRMMPMLKLDPALLEQPLYR